MPYTLVETDPKRIVQILMAWLDAPEEEGEDGFEIDPYDDLRERGQ